MFKLLFLLDLLCRVGAKMLNKFDQIHDSVFEAWGFSFRRSQLFRFKKYCDILDKLNINGGVLEIGCSIGFFTSKDLYPPYKDRLKACDISPVAVNKAKIRYPYIDFEVSSLPETGYEDNQFELVTVLEVLSYLSEDERIRSIGELHRITQDNGYILVSVKIDNKPYFTVEEIESLVTRRFRITRTVSTYIKSYFETVETSIWLVLTLVSDPRKYELKDVDSAAKRILKLLINALLKNKVAYYSYGRMIQYFCKGLLYFTPIGLIDLVSRKSNQQKERNRHIILAQKVSNNSVCLSQSNGFNE